VTPIAPPVYQPALPVGLSQPTQMPVSYHPQAASGGTGVAQRRPLSAGTALGSCAGGGTIQAKWIRTSLNSQYWRWDTQINGVRWYMHKREDFGLYYYMVEQPNRTNAHMIENQGFELRRGDFECTGHDEPPKGEIDDSVDEVDPGGWKDKDYAPFLHRVVAHREDGPRWKEITAYRLGNNQNKFEKERGVAKPALNNLKNLDQYVFHLTTLRNLFFAPTGSMRNTGILSRGLDPGEGGGPGGACETCEVLKDKSMLEDSIKNSKGVVAVTTALSNLKMYGNQRHEYTSKAFSQGKYGEMDLVGRESILLRFRLKKRHMEVMEVDPQHPKDKMVQLIRGVQIEPRELEALTSDGWVPLLNLRALEGLFPVAERVEVRTPSVVSGLNTRPLPNPWAQPQPQLPWRVGAVLMGARNIDDNPRFWNNLNALIQELSPNSFAIRGLLTALQHTNRLILFRLRQHYREDLALVLGYRGRVDEDTQRTVIELIDEVVGQWEHNRPRLTDF
jgi:hypothetical protein